MEQQITNELNTTNINETNRKILFLKIDGVMYQNFGFASKKSANEWIDSHGEKLDWRAGFVFRLKGYPVDVEIVKKDGHRVKP